MPRFVLILLAMLAAVAAFAGDDKDKDKDYVPPIAAIIVNGETVSADAIRAYYDAWVNIYKGPGKKLTKELLDKLASTARYQATQHAAVRQYLEKNKLMDTPEAAKAALEAYKKELTEKGDSFEAVLKRRFETEAHFTAERALRDSMLKATEADVQKDIDKVKTLFEKEKQKLPSRRASQIRFTYEKSKFTAHNERSKDDAKKQATYALERAKKGEDFMALVKDLSDETVSKAKGGDFGWIAPSATIVPKAVVDAVFTLEKPGDIADLVESEQGFHVVKLTDLKTDEAEFQKYLKDYVYRMTLDAENRITKEAKVEKEKPPEPEKKPEADKKDESAKKNPSDPTKDANPKKEPDPSKAPDPKKDSDPKKDPDPKADPDKK